MLAKFYFEVIDVSEGRKARKDKSGKFGLKVKKDQFKS